LLLKVKGFPMGIEQDVDLRMHYLIPSVEVWTNNLGELVEGRICFDEDQEEAIEDVDTVIEYIKDNPNHAVMMKLYGFNLQTLKEAFYA